MNNKVVRIRSKKNKNKNSYAKRNILQIFVKIFLVLLAIAVLGTVIFFISCGKNHVVEEEVKEVNMPLISYYQGGSRFNTTQGQYTKPSENNYGSHSIVLEKNKLIFSITTPDKINSMKYKVTTLNGQGELEVRDINLKKSKISNSKNVKKNETLFQIKPTLYETILEYRLVITAKINDRKIYFVSRLLNTESDSIKDNASFAKAFSNSTFDNTKLNKYESYLESNRNESEDNFGHVTIKSSIDYIGWNNLNVKKLTKTKYFLDDVKEKTYSFVFKYRIQIKRDKINERYLVTEKIGTAINKGKKYLMSYERNLEREILQGDEIVQGSNISLSFGKYKNSKNKYRSENNGEIISFVIGETLWQYNSDDGSLNRIYPFLKENMSYDRMINERDIRIVNSSDDGSLTFLVAGNSLYSDSTGQTGLGVYYYEGCETKRVYQDAFVESGLRITEIKKQLYKFVSDFHNDGLVYYLADNKLLYSDAKGIHNLEDINDSSLFTSSEDGNMIAYNDKDGNIRIWNLQKGSNNTIDSPSGYIYRVIGFMGNNLAYSVNENSTKPVEINNQKYYPYREMHIVDIMGRIIKQYDSGSEYYINASIVNNNVELQLGNKTDDGFVFSDKEYINSNQKTSKSISKINIYLSTEFGICSDLHFKKKLKKIKYSSSNLVSEIRR